MASAKPTKSSAPGCYAIPLINVRRTFSENLFQGHLLVVRDAYVHLEFLSGVLEYPDSCRVTKEMSKSECGGMFVCSSSGSGLRMDLFPSQPSSYSSFSLPISIFLIHSIKTTHQRRVPMKPATQLLGAYPIPLPCQINQHCPRRHPPPVASWSSKVITGYSMFLRHCLNQSTKWYLRSLCLNLPPLSPLVHFLNKLLVSQETLIHDIIVPLHMSLPYPFFHKLPVGSPHLC